MYEFAFGANSEAKEASAAQLKFEAWFRVRAWARAIARARARAGAGARARARVTTYTGTCIQETSGGLSLA